MGYKQRNTEEKAIVFYFFGRRRINIFYVAATRSRKSIRLAAF